MTPYQAQRIRFGILAARHTLERHRLTPGQVDDLEGMEVAGWTASHGGVVKAFEREYEEARSRMALKSFGIRAAELRKRWLV